jgi:hypothetical protein
MKVKEVLSLQVLATKKLAGLYFEEISAKYLLKLSFYLPRIIVDKIVSEMDCDWENILTVRGGNTMYFVLAPEEGDFGDKPYDCQSMVLENKLNKKLFFQITPLFAADYSFNCKTWFFPVSSIEPNECISFDVYVNLSRPLTFRQRYQKIKSEIETKGHLFIMVWDVHPTEQVVDHKRGLIALDCALFLGKNLPLNFELMMQVTNRKNVQNQTTSFYEQKDHVKRYFFD